MKKTNTHGIREIAEALDVSIGTVDRALHDREGISAKTREKVLKMAEKLHYTPNLAARNLKLNQHLKIGVYLPQEVPYYYETLRDGVRAAARTESGLNIDLYFYSYPTLGVGDLEVMRKTRWQQFDGIILAPGHPTAMSEIFVQAAEQEKPIVCVTTDAHRMTRLAAVCADAFVSGSIAAELLGGWVAGEGEVALFTGDLQVQDHADKLRGFAATLAMLAPHLTLIPAIESHDLFDKAYGAAKLALKEHPKLRGVYINTTNSLPVLRALREAGRLQSIRTITTDLFPELVQFLERGEVSASLYQRPFTQGRLALEVLCAFLARGTKPSINTRLAPHLVLRSNLCLFTDHLVRNTENHS